MYTKTYLQQAQAGQSYHLAHSSGIAHAAICGLKFKLPHVMGASRSTEESFFPGNIAHQVLDQASHTIIELWNSRASAEEIIATWTPYLQQTVDEVNWEEYRISNREGHIATALSRLNDIAQILSEKMQDDPVPNRILSEITITNPNEKHEGRIDVIFEYSDHSETVEWKTYGEKGISSYDRFQIISNGMLVNYRNSRAEDDFSNNTLTIITPSKIHHPRPLPNAIVKIQQARKYILDTLNGEKVKASLPYYAVCEQCPFLDPCKFYMNDTTNPEEKRLLWRRRYRILKKREMTHINKILLGSLTLDQLRELKVADYGYRVSDMRTANGIKTLWLDKTDSSHRLYKGDSIRIIGHEQNIPVLACINSTGTIRDINDNQAIVDIYRGNPTQLMNLPIVLLKTDVDLTRRELEAIDTVHRSVGKLQHFAYGLLGNSK